MKIRSLLYLLISISGYSQHILAMAPAQAQLDIVINESNMPVTVYKLANRNDNDIIKIKPNSASEITLPPLAPLAVHNPPFNEYYIVTVGNHTAFIITYDGNRIYFVKATQPLTDPLNPARNVAQVIHNNVVNTIQNANNPMNPERWAQPIRQVNPAHLVVVINQAGMLEFRKKQ